jgi:hypothetical protein
LLKGFGELVELLETPVPEPAKSGWRYISRFRSIGCFRALSRVGNLLESYQECALN